ncbi:hypothetical protein MK805_06080 [Shimazuella sp. AN120528]|uniref:hypothetical protein n=1 Tax=Shimazuella soli TaxID=1892854 RepID=UPI001F0F0E5D|nr:hypothetical protein [Shimazuella soli]MCH5584537.1 hypothetical protein [Shimazuella soli]
MKINLPTWLTKALAVLWEILKYIVNLYFEFLSTLGVYAVVPAFYCVLGLAYWFPLSPGEKFLIFGAACLFFQHLQYSVFRWFHMKKFNQVKQNGVEYPFMSIFIFGFLYFHWCNEAKKMMKEDRVKSL